MMPLHRLSAIGFARSSPISKMLVAVDTFDRLLADLDGGNLKTSAVIEQLLGARIALRRTMPAGVKSRAMRPKGDPVCGSERKLDGKRDIHSAPAKRMLSQSLNQLTKRHGH